MTTPSLHEVAAMPFPASLKAMREHYNPDWGRDRDAADLQNATADSASQEFATRLLDGLARSAAKGGLNG